MKYSDKLKDPRWQKKRLDILNRDEFTCRSCGDKESTLHVHHTYYAPNFNPWDYDSQFLVTLCETCHQEESENRKETEDRLLLALRINGYSHTDIDEIASFLVELPINDAKIVLSEEMHKFRAVCREREAVKCPG